MPGDFTGSLPACPLEQQFCTIPYPEEVDRDRLTFALSLGGEIPSGQGLALEPGRWHILKLDWRVEHKRPRDRWPGECTVSLNGKAVLTLPQLNRAKAGLCYLRLNSTASEMDSAGFLIERVSAEVVR